MTVDATPLVVDMDGTMFTTDSDTIMRKRLRRRPLRYARGMLLRRLDRKAASKNYFYRHTTVTPDDFIAYAPVHSWLQQAARDGRTLVLATGAPEPLARAVAERFPFFTEVFGTTGTYNNTGARKANRLVERFGDKGFDYAGNAPADLAVWRHARRGIVCNATADLREQAARLCEIEREL